MFPRRRYTVAVLGATGAVGRELLQTLDQRRFPTAEVRALCSERSAGEELSFGKRTLRAHAVVPEQLEGVEILFVAAGDEAAARWIPAAREAGAVCVDVSRWSAAQADVPLAVPDLNAEVLADHTGLIASPCAAALVCAVALHPLRDLGLSHVDVTSLEPASGAGLGGLNELSKQTVSLLNFQPVDVEVHPHRLAFNVYPQVGDLGEGGASAGERALEQDLTRLLGVPTLATAVRVPVFVGTSVSVTARLQRSATLDEVRGRLEGVAGLTLVDAGYPMPMDVAEASDVRVGRLRVDGNVVRLWAVSDNLKRGAAVNLVQVAELLDAVWTAAQA